MFCVHKLKQLLRLYWCLRALIAGGLQECLGFIWLVLIKLWQADMLLEYQSPLMQGLAVTWPWSHLVSREYWGHRKWHTHLFSQHTHEKCCFGACVSLHWCWQLQGATVLLGLQVSCTCNCDTGSKAVRLEQEHKKVLTFVHFNVKSCCFQRQNRRSFRLCMISQTPQRAWT